MSAPASHLDRIVAAVREALSHRRAALPFPEMAVRARAPRARREIRLRRGDVPGIIAEIKRASPSRGWIRRDLDAAAAAAAYVRGGACAVSVLTEGRFFGGSLADLEAASAAAGAVPVLRKDFILDEYMIAESRAHGADLVLLMVSVLGGETGEMVRLAREYGLEPLVEVHGEGELECAVRAGARLVGINNRSLATLRVDLGISARLLPLVPAGTFRIVESGISKPAEIARLCALGADAFLVGEAVAGREDLEAAVRELARPLRFQIDQPHKERT